MISLNWLPEAGFLFILIFARVGTMLMLIPALGERVNAASGSMGVALTSCTVPAAGILTLSHARTMVYKYGGSDARCSVSCRGAAHPAWAEARHRCNESPLLCNR